MNESDLNYANASVREASANESESERVESRRSTTCSEEARVRANLDSISERFCTGWRSVNLFLKINVCNIYKIL